MASTKPRTRGRTAAFTLAGVFALVAVALIVFFSGEAPDAVDIEGTVAGLDAGATSPEDGAEPVADTGDPSGTWTVRTDVEPFSFDASTGSFLGFRVDEELSTIGATQAVGRLPDVTGELTLDGTTVTAATFTGQVASLVTDQRRRDSRTRSALGTDTVSFTLTGPLELEAVPTPGATIRATAVGALTINDVTREVEVPLEAALSTNGVLVVTSSFEVLLPDHDVRPPSAPMVVSVSDTATVEVQLLLTRG